MYHNFYTTVRPPHNIYYNLLSIIYYLLRAGTRSVRVRGLVGPGRRRPGRSRGRVQVVRLVGDGVRVYGREVVQLRLQIVMDGRGEETRSLLLLLVLLVLLVLLLLLLLLVMVERRHGGRGRAHRGCGRGHGRESRVRVHERRVRHSGQLIGRAHLKQRTRRSDRIVYDMGLGLLLIKYKFHHKR